MDKSVLTLSLGILLVQPTQAAVFSNWVPAEQAVFDLVNLQRDLNGLGSLIADSRLHDAATGHSTDMSVNNFFSHAGTGGTSSSQRISASGYDWNQPGGSAGENIAAGYGVSFSLAGVGMVAADDAARLVMYGTSNLAEISSFSTNNGGQTFNSWSDVGTGWGDSLWDTWHGFKGKSGGWMGSSGHRTNILAGIFTDLGVGLVFDPDDQIISGYEAPFYTYWTQNFASGDSVSNVPVPSAFPLFLSAFSLLVVSWRRKNQLLGS